MPSAAVATATSPLWFATRATGLMALVLLTGTVVLGILTSVRFASPAWPRFVTVSLHRNLSLLTITFTGLHVLTTITDPFASISALSVVVPFTSGYRRIWLGFGAVAFDLLLAVLVTSLLRTRIGPRGWRAVHWAGYACWPVALVHGLGTGTDGAARWVLAITAVCALAVVSAGVWRLAAGWPAHAGLRVAAAAAAVAVALATAGWAWAGPLGPGWARRAWHADGAARALLGERRHRKRQPGYRVQRGERSKRHSFGIRCFSCSSIPGAARGNGHVRAGTGQRGQRRHPRDGGRDRGAAEDRDQRAGRAGRRRDEREQRHARPCGRSGPVHRARGRARGVRDTGDRLRAGQRLSLAIDLTSQTSTAVTGTVTAQQAGE